MRHVLVAVLLALPASARPEQALVAHGISCRGEEPFWAIEAGPSRARLRTPEIEVSLDGRLDELDWLPPGWLVWRSIGAERLAITLRAESCSSTMADTPPLSHRAILVRGDLPTAAGCCSVTRGYDAMSAPVTDAATKPPDDWSRLLPDLLPGVLRCVAAAGGQVIEVSKAWPMNHGTMGVRLADRDGGRQDCIVEIDGNRLDQLYAAGAPLPGEGRPVFLPRVGSAPLVAAGRLERVLEPSGTLAGWLHYRD